MSRALGIMLLLLPWPLLASTLHYVGTAVEPDDDAIVYTEAYTERFNATGNLTATTVDYRHRDGSPLASKALDYTRHPYAPAFDFHNQATGYRESVSWLSDGRVRLSHQDPGKSPQEKILQIPEPAVADAGFNQYIRDHLPQLKSGQTLRFHFLNPARLDWFVFTARTIAADSNTLTVKVAPGSRVLRWLVSPIELVYSEADGRLLEYRGLTNISLKDGNTVSAHIRYDYQDDSNTALLPDTKALEYRLTPPEG